MKRTRYTKYVPDPAGEMSMEDLLSALSDYLLQSGFQDYMGYGEMDGEPTLDEQMREQLQQMQAEGTLDDLIDQLLQRMEQEDYISIDDPHDPTRPSTT